jgi:hypothetical protein
LTEHTHIPIIQKTLSTVFLQLSGELEVLSHDLKDIEDNVAKALSAVSNPDHQIIAKLQKIDSSIQTLEALATFTSNMAVEIPLDYTADVGSASAPLLLYDLVSRLRLCGESDNNIKAKEDNYEFF